MVVAIRNNLCVMHLCGSMALGSNTSSINLYMTVSLLGLVYYTEISSQ